MRRGVWGLGDGVGIAPTPGLEDLLDGGTPPAISSAVLTTLWMGLCRFQGCRHQRLRRQSAVLMALEMFLECNV
ncbi:hypothetical protein AAFF_G00132230 [Aldrovandia affinis]|uniref:Uncharacterized protein n=1 Tax=Aldrovandia affinis TaxID=143900 RepID=A0AAD7RQI6_9TELE|nr:hypothetical protein AAFF_G00132230 [Aldrovandia affinis]